MAESTTEKTPLLSEPIKLNGDASEAVQKLQKIAQTEENVVVPVEISGKEVKSAGNGVSAAAPPELPPKPSQVAAKPPPVPAKSSEPPQPPAKPPQSSDSSSEPKKTRKRRKVKKQPKGNSMKRVWLACHVFLAIVGFVYVVYSGSRKLMWRSRNLADSLLYRSCCIAAVSVFGLSVYNQFGGKPGTKPVIPPFTVLLASESFRFFLLALIWLISEELVLKIAPFTVYSVLQVANYIVSTKEKERSPFHGVAQEILSHDIRLIELAAGFDFLLFLRLIYKTVTFQGLSGYVLVLFALFYRMRLFYSPSLQSLVEKLFEKTDKLILKAPPQAQKIYEQFKAMVDQETSGKLEESAQTATGNGNSGRKSSKSTEKGDESSLKSSANLEKQKTSSTVNLEKQKTSSSSAASTTAKSSKSGKSGEPGEPGLRRADSLKRVDELADTKKKNSYKKEATGPGPSGPSQPDPERTPK